MNTEPKTPENQDPIDWNALSTEEFGDALIAKMEVNGPPLTGGQAELMERLLSDRGRERRIALTILTEPFLSLARKVEEDRGLAMVLAMLHLYLQDLTLYSDLARLIEQANCWAMIALCYREDMNEVLAEAKATMTP